VNPDKVQSGEKKVCSAPDTAEHDGVSQHNLVDADGLVSDTGAVALVTHL
jgi:hypothetical protein